MEKIGVKWSMAIGSFFTVPMLIVFIAPSVKADNTSDLSVWVSYGMVYALIIIGSMLDGLG